MPTLIRSRPAPQPTAAKLFAVWLGVVGGLFTLYLGVSCLILAVTHVLARHQ